MSSVVETRVAGKSRTRIAHLSRARQVPHILTEAWQELRDRAAFQLAVLCRAKRVSRKTVRLVLDELGRHASWEYADCYPSEQRIAERIDSSVSQVRQALRVLEALKLVETYTKADAIAIYGANPCHDKRQNAYRLAPLAAAWKCNRRAPLVDKRSAWQRHHARIGWRQQMRQAMREQERISGVRPVWLPYLGRVELVASHQGAQKPAQGGLKPRRGQPVHVGAASPAIAACAPRGSTPPGRRQMPPMVGVQPQEDKRSQSADSGKELASTWLSRLKEARGGVPPRGSPQ